MVKTYRQHRCSSNHRSARTFLNCAIPRAAWIQGSGDYALIAWCRVPTISLWSNPEDAAPAMSMIAATGCGGRCSGRHELVRIDLAGVTHAR